MHAAATNTTASTAAAAYTVEAGSLFERIAQPVHECTLCPFVGHSGLELGEHVMRAHQCNPLRAKPILELCEPLAARGKKRAASATVDDTTTAKALPLVDGIVVSTL